MYTFIGITMGKQEILKILRSRPEKSFSRRELAELTMVNEVSISSALKGLIKEKEFYKIEVTEGRNKTNKKILLYTSL